MNEYNKVIQMIEDLERSLVEAKVKEGSLALVTARCIKVAVMLLEKKEMAEMGAEYELKG